MGTVDRAGRGDRKSPRSSCCPRAGSWTRSWPSTCGLGHRPRGRRCRARGAVVIELDTPGGSLDSTREIVQTELSAAGAGASCGSAQPALSAASAGHLHHARLARGLDGTGHQHRRRHAHLVRWPGHPGGPRREGHERHHRHHHLDRRRSGTVRSSGLSPRSPRPCPSPWTRHSSAGAIDIKVGQHRAICSQQADGQDRRPWPGSRRGARDGGG